MYMCVFHLPVCLYMSMERYLYKHVHRCVHARADVFLSPCCDLHTYVHIVGASVYKCVCAGGVCSCP